ncbi:MAG: LysR family transcriptional regulator [Cellvibrionaceae bacterium]|nr:LysR family transcriptional regulator [Cellvibrionaceae bacterium]|tara:strand:+ start:163067 stop:163945 length:879 start_codon:yes stop_codon:yes gene_type:complete
MDTQHLKAFITVAKLNSFTAAANQLHLTQPAISKRIASLEEQLSCKLFDRVARDISLTQAGVELLPRAQQILQSVIDTELAISNLSGKIAGTLRLATSHHIGLHHLPQILKRFTQHYPDVHLELDFIDSEKAYAAVMRSDTELAIITLSSNTADNIHTVELWQDPLSFVVAKDHPLAQQPTLSLQQLAQYPAILPDTSTQTTRLVRQMFEQQGLTLSISMATNYLETIKMMVSIGLGWSTLPDTMIETEQVSELKVLTIHNSNLRRTLGCIHHKDRTLSNPARAFLSALTET